VFEAKCCCCCWNPLFELKRKKERSKSVERGMRTSVSSVLFLLLCWLCGFHSSFVPEKQA